MITAEEIRAWMRRVMQAHDLDPTSWAEQSGVARSTIFRALQEDYQFVTSTRTLGKLAQAVGEKPPSNLDVPDFVALPAQLLRIRYEVGAGLWQEVGGMRQLDFGSAPVLADAAYERFPQWLERVVGDSMDQEYPPGTLLHVVDTVALGYAPRAGDHVIVQRTRDQGGVAERTVKEVAFNSHGMQLVARSTNPRWANHPIVVNDGHDLDNCAVEIVGLVLGSYRSRRGGN